MKITLVISAITGGGAERVMSILANHWARQGHVVQLVTLYSDSIDFYQLHPEIRRSALDLAKQSNNLVQAILGNYRRIRAIRRAIVNFSSDCVISFSGTTNILTLLSCKGLDVPVIVSERTDPSQIGLGRIWEILRRLTYPFSKAVVVQTNSVCEWVRKNIPGANPVIIANPIREIPNNLDLWERPVDGKIIAAMGRLSAEKGFDFLIKAFSLIQKDFPSWSLALIGDGPMRDELEGLVVQYGLNEKVIFLGRIIEPYKVLLNVDLFILSSRREGFPNALLEAMMCGLPVISFNCPSGPADIISDGVNGILTEKEDWHQLAEMMKVMMSDSSMAKALGQEAKKVSEKYQVDKIMQQWETIMPRAGTLDLSE